jgi:UDP-2,3-diacylglucosamine hydrolase
VSSPTEGKPFLVVSDLHLGAVPAATERRFREFLDQEAREAAGLLINGDLFEFGMAYRSVVRREQVRVLAKLAELVESGVPVYFVAGNHDYLEWGGHVLQEDAGVQVLRDPVVMEIAGRRALVTHGDTAGRGATRERIERWLARRRLVVGFLRLLPPDLVDRLQPYMTSTRRQVRRYAAGQGGGPKRRAPGIEAWALEALRDDPSLDLVIAGHSHLPALVEVEPGRYYLNAGDWITHDSYLVLPEDGPPEIRHWPGGREAAVSTP